MKYLFLNYINTLDSFTQGIKRVSTWRCINDSEYLKLTNITKNIETSNSYFKQRDIYFYIIT